MLVVDLQLTHCVWQLIHAADGLLIDHFVLCVCKQISMWGSVLGQNASISVLLHIRTLMTAYTVSLSVQKQEAMRYTTRDRQMIELACFVSWRLRLAAILSTS